MERILVLTDFSDVATRGLEAAAQIARQLGGAEILLLNTERSVTGRRLAVSGDITKQLDPEEELYMIELIRVNQKRLRELSAQYSSDGVKVSPYMEIGPMQDIVDEFLDKHRVDLIVMGTSGESTIEEYFVGNHTEQVIRVANVPVLSVKLTDHLPGFSKIVLATDLNKDAARGLKPVQSLASKLGAKLFLVHVTSSKPEKVRQEIEDYAAKNGLLNYTVNVVNDKDTEEGIKKFATETAADMIAVITHGREGLSSLLSHSVAEDVIKEASIPVLTINMKAVK